MKLLLAIPVALLFSTVMVQQRALAWGDSGGIGGYWNHGCCGSGEEYQGEYQGGQIGCGPYCAGQNDAIYDHEQGLIYNPQPQCCHSQYYQERFHEGYDHQWNSYQSQESSQGASINVIDSPGAYVSTNQYSNQQQNPLQQLGHVVCGFINCNQAQGGPYP